MGGFFLSCYMNARLTYSWAGSSVQVSHASGDRTWNFSSRFIDRDATAYEVVQDMAAYFDAEYSGTMDFSFSVADTTSGKGLTLISTASVTWTVSTGLQGMLGWSASATAASIGTPSGSAVVGGWKGKIGMGQYLRHDNGDGVGSTFGGYMTGTPVTAHRRPLFFSVLSEAEAASLADVLRVSSSPRRCQAYEEHTESYRTLALGVVKVDRLNLTHYSLSAEVLG